MKFFVSTLLLAILNFCLIFAEPNDYRQRDDIFIFWITTTRKAAIKGLIDKSVKDVVIPPYFVVDGERYYVTSIGDHAFSGYSIETVTIPNTIEKIDFDALAFEDCKKLKKITINAGKVTKIDVNAFRNANTNLVITGTAVPAFTDTMARTMVNYFDLKLDQDYNNVTPYNKKKALFTLAKQINKYITFDGNEDQGNPATALAIRHASWGGFARTFYHCALAMGFKNTEILIAGDARVSAWNYVKIDNKWYSVDVARFEFGNLTYSNSFFMTNSQMSSFLNKHQPTGARNNYPAQWVVCLDIYHYKGNSNNNVTTNFNKYLADKKIGGTRV